MRDKGTFSQSDYQSQAKIVKDKGGGVATFQAEERVRQGMGLDPLVDPKGLPKYGPVRSSGNLLIPEGDAFVLKFGVAMPVETSTDTTASMGNNVDIVFEVQPKVQNLLNNTTTGVLRRYHTQMATASIGDRLNKFPYQRSQFEPDNEVARQMAMLVPERQGNDSTEDYQLDLFAAAYLSSTSITKYGLKGYRFIIGDERGRDEFDPKILEKVFGPSVYEKAFGRRPERLPSTKEAAKKAMQDWHVFFLQVYDTDYTTAWWTEMIGADRVIRIPRTEYVAEIQAVVIGLTEGLFDLEGAREFLKASGSTRRTADDIIDACSKIPLGLQKTFENFDKIPLAGAKFASRDDIWPIGVKGTSPVKSAKKGKPDPKNDEPKGKKKDKSWKV